MNVTFVHADAPAEFNSANWRSFIPAAAFNRTKRHRAMLLGIGDFTGHPPVAEYHCADSEAIILQRGAMPAAWEAVEYWKQRGKLIISDIDDGYPQIGPEHPAYNFWHKGIARGPDGRPMQLPRPSILDMAEGLTKVHGLTSPNKLILADWKAQVGVPGAFLPNYPDVRVYQAQRTRSPADDGLTWVAWGGSAGHLQSFTDSGVLYALARVLSRRPLTRFVFVGSDLRQLNAVPLKDGQKQHFNWTPYRDWPALLVNFDIGIIPSVGEFDARRSWLKAMEHSLMGVPWIASKAPNHDGLDDYGVLVDNTPDAWAAALTDLLAHGPDPERVRRARKWALAQNIDLHVDDMVRIYRSFWK